MHPTPTYRFREVRDALLIALGLAVLGYPLLVGLLLIGGR